MMPMIATTTINSMREKPRSPAARAWRRLRSHSIQQLPPGHTLDACRTGPRLQLRVAPVVEAGVHVLAEEDRVVRTAVVGHARIRGVRIAVVQVAFVTDGSIPADVEERIRQAPARERIDGHREARARGRAGVGRVGEAGGSDQDIALEEV